MRIALNGATIMRAPLADDIAIAAACGFSALEVWAGKLAGYLAERPLTGLTAQLRDASIVPWCINSIEDITYRDAGGRRALLAQTRETAAVARAIGAPAIVVVPGPLPGSPSRSPVDEAVEVLREMAEAAGDTGLAFEFLGKLGCAVPTLDLAIEIVERVDLPNVGMVVDLFHFYAGGSRMEDIGRIPVEKLFVVHLNGCEDLSRDQLTDAHRLYPGEGVLPGAAILSALRERGFDGVASVEIFRPEYWAQEPRQVALTAYERAAALLAAAGYRVTEASPPAGAARAGDG